MCLKKRRAIVPNWTMEVEVGYIPTRLKSGEVIDHNDIIRWMTDAGRHCGIGAGCSYGFGRFEVVQITVAK